MMYIKYKKSLLGIAVLLFSLVSYAQKIEDATFLTIDGMDYDAGTFMKFYFKNIDIVQDEEQKDIDNYLDLYIDYRLKLQQAYELELDKKESHIREMTL